MASNNGISCDGVEKATRCQCKKAGCIKNGGGKCKCAKTGEFCGDQCLCKGNCHNTPEGLNGTRGVKRLNSGGVIGGKRQKTSGGPGSPFGGRSRTSSTGVHIVIRGPSAASGTIDHHPHPQHHHLQSMEQQQQQQQQQAYNPFHHHHHPHHANGQHFGEVGAAAASSSSALVTSSSSSTTSGAGGGGMDEYEPPTPQSKEKECDYCGVVGQRTGMVRCKRCKSAYYCDEKCESAAADNHAPQCYPRVMPKSVIGLKRHLQELGFVGEPSMCVMAGLVNGTLPKVLRPEDLDRKWWPKEWVRGCEWVEQFDVSSLDSSDELNSADDVDHDEVANAPPGAYCRKCRRPLCIRALLHQGDYGGWDYYEVEHGARCVCGTPFRFYVTNLCNGSPTIDCGKFHNHCTQCRMFGQCIGDYRETHCGQCESHYYGCMGRFPCPNCQKEPGLDPVDFDSFF